MPRACAGYVAQVHYYWEKQAIATLSQVNPTQNQWYTLLALTDDVRLLHVAVRQTNDESAVKTTEVRVTSDGIALVGTKGNMPHNTVHYGYIQQIADAMALVTTILNASYYSDMRALSMKIEVRITAVGGTNQLLEAWAQYEKHVAT